MRHILYYTHYVPHSIICQELFCGKIKFLIFDDFDAGGELSMRDLQRCMPKDGQMRDVIQACYEQL
jgi:hypothetical protein